MKVPLLDLKLQYRSIKDEILPGLHEAFDSQQFIMGPKVEKFETDFAVYCGTKYAVGVNSGSDALLLSMMAMGIGRGDKVITTPFTFFATVGSICRLGATPLFVDIDPDTFNLCPQKLGELLQSMSDGDIRQTKAIMPVHLYGQCADMEPIRQAAGRYNLKIIEDAAQALGASCRLEGQTRMACALGDYGCTSFFPSKNLGAFGDAGMIATNDEETALRLKSLRMHGQASGNYYHRHIGMNARIDAIQAIVLTAKLPHLDRWAQKRRENAACYATLLEQAGLVGQVTLPAVKPGNTHVFNQFVIRASGRDGLKAHLEQNGVGCAIYYPLPLHLQECFKFLGGKPGDFAESEKASRETLALPVFPELSREQIEYVVEQIEAFYRRE